MDSGQIPYGYRLKDGEKVKEPSEVWIIDKMCELYEVGNTTYQKLADLFNTKYKSDKLWTKSKVKRILEDKRYLGEQGFPPIMSQERYNKIMSIKDSRNKNKLVIPDVEAIKKKAICHECGKPYKRHMKTKHKSTWYCSSEVCKTDFRIEDHIVKNEIILLLNKVRNEPELLDTELTSQPKETGKIKRIKAQIEQGITRRRKFADIMKMANELIQEQYDNDNNGYENEMTEFIKNRLEKEIEITTFEIGLFNDVISEVRISHTGKIYIKFANDKIVS